MGHLARGAPLLSDRVREPRCWCCCSGPTASSPAAAVRVSSPKPPARARASRHPSPPAGPDAGSASRHPREATMIVACRRTGYAARPGARISGLRGWCDWCGSYGWCDSRCASRRASPARGAPARARARLRPARGAARACTPRALRPRLRLGHGLLRLLEVALERRSEAAAVAARVGEEGAQVLVEVARALAGVTAALLLQVGERRGRRFERLAQALQRGRLLEARVRVARGWSCARRSSCARSTRASASCGSSRCASGPRARWTTANASRARWTSWLVASMTPVLGIAMWCAASLQKRDDAE